MEDKDDGDDRRDRFGRDRRRRERSRSRSRSRSASPGRRRKSGDNRDRDRDNRRSQPRRRTLEELMREPLLLSLGQFMDALGIGRDDGEVQKKYDEYKLEFSKKGARPFFEEHKNDAWFREKYHPTYLEQRRTEKIARVEQATKDFVKDIASGTVAPVLTEDVHANDAQADKAPTNDSTCVYIKNILPSIARSDLKKVLSSVEGAPLLRLRVSEPMPNKGWIRLAWAFFENEAAADKVLASLATQKVNGADLTAEKAKDADSGRRPRVAPYVSSDEGRIAADLDLAKQLSQKLLNDLVPANPQAIELLAAVEGAPAATPALRLDLLITYLRNVHHYCLYCSEQYEDDEELRRRCGPLHVRGRKKEAGVLPDPATQQWAQLHETKLKASIAAPDASSTLLGKALFEKLWDGFMSRLDDKKWQCTICGKMFMGAEFVKKHLALKHQDKQTETQTKAADEQFFHNFVLDPQRLGHAPLAPPMLAPAPVAPAAFGADRGADRDRGDRGGGRREYRDNRRGNRGFRDRERDLNRDDPGVSAINSARGPLRSYVDLDAPAADDSFADFHTAL